MVLSAEYIKKKLEQEMVLSQAFGRDLVSIGFPSPLAGHTEDISLKHWFLGKPPCP